MPNSGGSELAVLQRHLPQIVVTRFLNNPERLRGPESSSFLAAVALFDISGFSSLGSRLSEDERRRSKEGGKTSHGSTNNNSTAAPSPTAAAIHQAANQGPTSVSARTRSGSILSSPSKAKSRGSQPMSLLSGLGSPSTRSLNSLSRRDTSHRQMCDEDSTLDDEDDPLPSDIMRQRRTSSMSSSSMSFMHGPKSAIVSQGIAVESLTTTLNKSLEPVINVILEHGGDIVKFAGDALIVMWETEATQNKVTPSGELVYRAVCCAIEALRALGAAVAASTEHENEDTHLTLLGMHVGIGVSQVTGNHVGGVLNRWEFYLSGDANRQMSSAEESAQKGQLALSPESYEALQGRLDKVPELVVACHYSGNYLVQEVPDVSFCSTVTEEQRARASSVVHEVGAELLGCLRSYVPGAIASSLQKGLMLTPCRLNVTVAFVKLEGVVGIKNAQDQLQVIHQTLCNIQECAYKAQGTLRQFVIDDKGAVAIVAIGLPPFFHENNGTCLTRWKLPT
ncbi:hypothetical protein PHYBOEH_001763 [Phytophthora boehmeriae]|uniref:Guanylate cyclase domain-containing protein n=1 Tax=Phytophthora boehmeriae TaxID=109152 RepID=A0A8T1X5I2_9STRA|nr:hypothetical protein PHYBOEH_001763 [Phytophthora boehmeriae]